MPELNDDPMGQMIQSHSQCAVKICTSVSNTVAAGKAGTAADGQAVEAESQAEQADMEEMLLRWQGMQLLLQI